jgi:hypothetical protein
MGWVGCSLLQEHWFWRTNRKTSQLPAASASRAGETPALLAGEGSNLSFPWTSRLQACMSILGTKALPRPTMFLPLTSSSLGLSATAVCECISCLICWLVVAWQVDLAIRRVLGAGWCRRALAALALFQNALVTIAHCQNISCAIIVVGLPRSVGNPFLAGSTE